VLKTSKRLLLSYWLPVVLMIIVIMLESTDMFGSDQTSRLIYPVVNWITLNLTGHAMDYPFFLQLHAVLRKVGHLTGYGLLCAVWFRAIRATARGHLLRHSFEWNWFWTHTWARNAFLMTALIASADEIHQRFLPSRTGEFRDVLIDSSGALIALGIAYIISRKSYQREQSRRVLQVS
jgi:VanZ like family